MRGEGRENKFKGFLPKMASQAHITSRPTEDVGIIHARLADFQYRYLVPYQLMED